MIHPTYYVCVCVSLCDWEYYYTYSVKCLSLLFVLCILVAKCVCIYFLHFSSLFPFFHFNYCVLILQNYIPLKRCMFYDPMLFENNLEIKIIQSLVNFCESYPHRNVYIMEFASYINFCGTHPIYISFQLVIATQIIRFDTNIMSYIFTLLYSFCQRGTE